MPDIENVKYYLNEIIRGNWATINICGVCQKALELIEAMEQTINDIDGYARELQKGVQEYEAQTHDSPT